MAAGSDQAEHHAEKQGAELMSKERFTSFLFAGWIICACGSWAHGQYQHSGTVISGFGGRSTGGSYTHLGSGAQPGGIRTSYEGGSADYDGGHINRAGFLNMFVLFPDLDTDNNGLPDELDPDNDGDELWDHWEVSGEKFTPATPTDPNLLDSDADGSSDYAELIAGTDPTDINAAFRFIAIEQDGLMGALSWPARGNHERIYVLSVRDGSYDGKPDIVIWSNTVAGGVAPWYAVTNTISEPLTDGSFYAIEVIRP
jgi:hypothetical protein